MRCSRTLTSHGSAPSVRKSATSPGRLVCTPELPHLIFGTPPATTVRYFPDKLPIGVDSGHSRHVFVYLIARRRAGRFPRLPASACGAARSALRVDDSPAGATASRRCDAALPAARQTTSSRTPLRPDTSDELRWFFEQRRNAADRPAIVADARFQRAQQAFATPALSRVVSQLVAGWRGRVAGHAVARAVRGVGAPQRRTRMAGTAASNITTWPLWSARRDGDGPG